MTDTQTATATQVQLASMLVQNTGASILDSGSAYGRHWERNAGKTVQDFINAPYQTVDLEWSQVTLDLFHYLDDRLNFDTELHTAFKSFAETMPDDYWSDVMTAWLESLGVDTSDDDFYGGHYSFNTYNFGTEAISQTIQGTGFNLGDKSYVLLQIHNGCDVRGGYTSPAVFEVVGEMFPYDCSDWVLTCGNPDCDFQVSSSGGYLDSDSDKMPDHWELTMGCPDCGGHTLE